MENKELSSAVLFRDNHLIAFNKPAGLATQPSWSTKENLEDSARQWLKKEMSKPGNVFVHAVHRIDLAASGIALFAKTGKSLSRMNELMRKREIKRVYRVIVSPPPPAAEGRLKDYMRHSSMKAVGAGKNNPAAKEAVLDYRRITSSGNIAELEVEIVTGRYHQIRFQLSRLGSPVAGDIKYGSLVNAGKNRIYLHHYKMGFIHPVTKNPVSITAPVPSYWSS